MEAVVDINEEVKNVPMLRFPGFEGEWIEKKLRDITKINQGLQIAISDRYTEDVEGGHFYITNEFIKEGSQKKYFIKNPPKSVLCVDEDLLMTRTGNTGIVVTGVNGAFHNNFFKIKFDKEQLTRWFLYYLLTSHKTQVKILKLAGASTIPDLNHGDFYRIALKFPSLLEQQKIATFLSAIDDKIQQLSKKKALLEKFKKGVMQQIFSQKIRFKDETGQDFLEWEETTLGNFLSFKNGINADKQKYGTGVKFINVLDIINNRFITYDNILGSVEISQMEFEKNEIRYGDIVFQRSSETREEVGQSNVYLDKNKSVTFGGFVIRGRAIKEYHPLFMNYLLKTARVRKEITSKSGGSTRYNIGQESLKEVNVLLPCISEQKVIADFISAIDDKITLVTKQFEQAQQFKKGLLQQMFV